MRVNDVRHAFRTLMRDRWLTLGIVLILAVPTGVNTAVFSMAQAIAFRPFAVPDLHRIVAVSETLPKTGTDRHQVSVANFVDWREQTRLIDLAAYRRTTGGLRRDSSVEPVSVCYVSDTIFSTLAIPAGTGRTLRRGDEDAGGSRAVISGRLWRRLGASPKVVGDVLIVNDAAFEIVGVMPDSFDFPVSTDLWTPLALTDAERRDRNARLLSVVGRLGAGVSVQQAQLEIGVIMRRLAAEHPLENAGRAADVTLLSDAVNPSAKQFLVVLGFAATFALLLACANVANLQLARGASRMTEMAIRLSLGASRWSVLRLLLAEGLLVGMVSALVAVPVAQWTLALTKAFATGAVTRNVAGWTRISVDSRAALFALLVGVVAGLAVVLPSILNLLKVDLHEVLKATGRTTGRSIAARFRTSLVVLEVAIAATLLVGCGLMLYAFGRLSHPLHGYDPDGLLTLRVTLPERTFPTRDGLVSATEQLLDGVRDVPGVKDVTLVNQLPSLGDGTSEPVLHAESTGDQFAAPTVMEVRVVPSGYFSTMEVPVVAGRPFTATDRSNSVPVAIVSTTAARRLWGHLGPGQSIRVGNEPVPLRVIGIVGDVNHFLLDRRPRPTIYLPMAQRPVRTFSLVARADDTAPTVASIRAAIAKIEPSQERSAVSSMRARLADIAGGVRVVAALLTVLTALAVLVAAAGIYAVVSYLVVLRRRDIAIRMALGANRTDVLRLFGLDIGRLVLVGAASGSLAGTGLGRSMEKMLTIVSVEYGPLLVSGTLVFLVSFVAIYLPVSRASARPISGLLR